MRLSGRTWPLFIGLTIAWGASYLFIRVAITHGLQPLPLVAMRLVIGAAVVWTVTLARRERLRTSRRQAILLPLVATVNIALPFFLVAWGERTVSSGLASVLNSTIPIFSVILAGVLLRDEPVTLRRSVGVAAGFSGVLVLFSGDLSGGHASHLAGQASIVTASLCYAVGAVLTRRLFRDLPALTIAAFSVTTAAVETVILSAIFQTPNFASIDFQGWISVLWLGVMGVGLAYLMAFSILAAWGAARYTLIAYALPVVGLTLGAIFLQEKLDLRIVVGSALVLAGIVLASFVRPQASRDSAIGSRTPARAAD
jgi:drug/metabolite transporter (DMT)-like permease